MNLPLPTHAALLADAERIMHMARRFQRHGHLEFGQLLAGVAVIAALVLALWLIVRVVRVRERRALHCPWALFDELCRAHQLDRATRRLLTRLAAAHGLDQPGLLFVESKRFSAATLDAAWKARQPQLDELRQRLFG